jgi:hypothetical protein
LFDAHGLEVQHLVSPQVSKKKMLGASFESCILNHSYNVVRNWFKYVHCYLIDECECMTITLIMWVCSPCAWTLARMSKSPILRWCTRIGLKGETTFHIEDGANNFHWKNWTFIFLFKFVFTHNIQEFIHQDDLDKLVTIEMLVTSMYDKYAKSFNLIFFMVLMSSILIFLHFLKFYSQYM